MLEKFKNKLVKELDSTKLIEQRKDEFTRNVRSALADVARRLAAGSQHICWVTWYAKADNTSINKELLIEYNDKMSLLLNELTATRVVLAAMDSNLHDNMTPFIKQLYSMDMAVGQAILKFNNSPDEAVKQLGNIYLESAEYEDFLLTHITKISKEPNNDLHNLQPITSTINMLKESTTAV